MQESKRGDDLVMSPQAVTKNPNEVPQGTAKKSDESKEKRVEKEDVIDDKSGPEALNYEGAMLIADNIKIENMPSNVESFLDEALKKLYNDEYLEAYEIFSNRFNSQEADSLASRYAWGIVSQNGIITNKGMQYNEQNT